MKSIRIFLAAMLIAPVALICSDVPGSATTGTERQEKTMSTVQPASGLASEQPATAATLNAVHNAANIKPLSAEATSAKEVKQDKQKTTTAVQSSKTLPSAQEAPAK